MKLTKRKGFNFFRSYYDVYNELETPEDKVAFMDALLNRQFQGVKPTELKGMAKFAYVSQTNSIDSQVKGFEDKTGIILNPATPPTEPPTDGGAEPPTLQVEVQGEEKGKVIVKEKGKDIPLESEFLIYCQSLIPENYINLEFSLKAKLEQWIENGWKDGHGKKIKNWKTKIKNTIPHLKPIYNAQSTNRTQQNKRDSDESTKGMLARLHEDLNNGK